MMKKSPAGYILDEIPELEEAELTLDIPSYRRIVGTDDASMGDSISFVVDVRDESFDL